MAEIRNVFDIASRALSSQVTRLNAVASNLANARAIAGSSEEAYRAVRPVFKTRYADDFARSGLSTTDVTQIVSLDRQPEKVYEPEHPKADDDGFVYVAAVDTDEELVEMLEASRQYQNTLEVVSTVRALMMRTINMGR
ncbi:MAG: flagellar basal body rod protein FlgC [Alphaproteobacteria bacterium]|nr:flagellar basal body rod protein FlgC [Alphaproteobacteria bacterium]